MNASDNISNETLLLNFYQGEISLFNSLWDNLADDLYNFASKLTCRDRQAEDYCQQAWEEILRHPGKYSEKIKEGAFNLKSYMITIIRNKYIDELRSSGRYEDLPIEETFEESISLNPGSKLELEQLLRNIEKCLAKLKAIYREIYILTKVAGYSLEEAAKLINVNPETAKTRRRVSYKHMKICLTKPKDGVLDALLSTPDITTQSISVSKQMMDQDDKQPDDDYLSDEIIDTLIKRTYKQAPIMLKKTLFKFL